MQGRSKKNLAQAWEDPKYIKQNFSAQDADCIYEFVSCSCETSNSSGLCNPF